MRYLMLTVAALAATPAAAQDRDDRGAYGALHAGVASVRDMRLAYFDEGGTFGGTGPRDTADFRADLKGAFAIGGTIGYDFGMVRADLQVDYARNRIRSLTLTQVNGQAVTLTPADGAEICDYLESDDCSVSGNTVSSSGAKLRQLSAMANLWLDIPTGSAVTPYVGGGLGVGGYEVEGEGRARFAWQLGAGVAFAMSPSVALTADFRHRQISGATIVDEDFPDAGVIVGKVRTNTVAAGLRFRF